MAKGKSNRGERDTSDIASLEELLSPITPTPLVSPLLSHLVEGPLYEVEDNRRFMPGYVSPRLSSGSPARIKAVSRGLAREGPAAGIAFSPSEYTVRCVRRKERREVIFAKRFHRRGRGGSRRRNFWSGVKC